MELVGAKVNQYTKHFNLDWIFSQVVVLVLLGLLQLLFGLLPLFFQSLLQKELSKAVKRSIGKTQKLDAT